MMRSAVLTLLLAGLCPVLATDYYVATSGNDGNNGLSPGTAWLTLAHAASTATTSGDSVTVADGVYSVSSTLTIAAGVVFQSVNGPGVTTMQSTGAAFKVLVVNSDAVVAGFEITDGYYWGGDTGMIALEDNATLESCDINGNVGRFGAVFPRDALIRNCLIETNSGQYAGAIYMQASVAGPGTVENCTITKNTATAGGPTFCGGIVFRNGKGIATNCIVVDNDDSGGGRQNWGGTPTSFTYSCTDPTSGGAGMITSPPQFVDAGGGNYRLAPGSPCLDTGTNLAWITAPGAEDLDGNARLVNGTVDMGCYELPLGGPLAVGFVADQVIAAAPLTVTFTATASGGNLNGLYYKWDFNNDGTFDDQGVGLDVAGHTYTTPGVYSVRVEVTNDTSEVATLTLPSYITVAPPLVYVSPSGNHVSPFTSWADAANDIHSALQVSASGTLVRVDDGVYNVTQTVDITPGISVQSENGAAVTTIRRTGSGSFRLLDVKEGSVIEGFELTNGYYTGGDTGVIAVRDGASMLSCEVHGNSGLFGAVFLYDGLLRNCLIHDNSGTYAGAIYIQTTGASPGPGTIESTTIYGNSASAGGAVFCGGIVFRNGRGVALNCIVYGNVDTGGGRQNWGGTPTSFTYSCTDITSGGAGMVVADPLLADPGAGDFSLTAASPAHNSGLDQGWMAGDTDIAGAPRSIGAATDMGALELNLPPDPACQDISVALDATGNATIVAGDIDDGTTEPDGQTFTLGVAPDSFTCGELGDNAVTLTATDSLGASDACTATVTVTNAGSCAELQTAVYAAVCAAAVPTSEAALLANIDQAIANFLGTSTICDTTVAACRAALLLAVGL